MGESADRTVTGAWQAFATELPSAMSPLVREEMRRAFYAGALAAYLLMLAACLAEDEAEGERLFEEIGSEMEAFTQELKLL